jgi:hypothetical protein
MLYLFVNNTLKGLLFMYLLGLLLGSIYQRFGRTGEFSSLASSSCSSTSLCC